MHQKIGNLSFVLTILALWLLPACAPTPPAQEQGDIEAGVYFSQLEPMDWMPLALIDVRFVD